MLGIARRASTADIRLISTTEITSTGSQTFTIPAGTQYVEIEMWGGGGGGGAGHSASGKGGSTSHYRGGGGGGGS